MTAVKTGAAGTGAAGTGRVRALVEWLARLDPTFTTLAMLRIGEAATSSRSIAPSISRGTA